MTQSEEIGLQAGKIYLLSDDKPIDFFHLPCSVREHILILRRFLEEYPKQMPFPHSTLEDTIVALATPPGTGAISVIRLSGPDAFAICNKLFPDKDLSRQRSHTIHFGTLRDRNEELDEVLISLFKGPRSYTREDVVEISCHGSEYIVGQMVVK